MTTLISVERSVPATGVGRLVDLVLSGSGCESISIVPAERGVAVWGKPPVFFDVTFDGLDLETANAVYAARKADRAAERS